MRKRRTTDHDRFEAIYRDTREQLLAYLLRRVPEPEHAADLLAEIYALAWRRIDAVPGGDEARLWLYGAARRLLANDSRKRTTRTATVDAIANELQTAPTSTPTSSDDTSSLRAALQRLHPEDRELLMLTGWEQLTPTEIAAAQQRTVGAVRVALHRARTRLRVALQEDSPAPISAMARTSNGA
jgi:RNA polymerase sigma-70 factor (ECF subfamily)